MKRAGWGMLAALALAACAPPPIGAWRDISVTAIPADLGAVRVGALRFVGGIELRSAEKAFGGLSDIYVSPDGAFVAIADTGAWVRGRLLLNGDGGPLDVTGVTIASMADENGRGFRNKNAGDSEGLALWPDGRAAVSFEQTQSIRLYDRPDVPAAPARAGPPLAETADLPLNAGLEAIAPLDPQRLLVGSEDQGRVWIVTAGDTRPAASIGAFDLPVGFGLVELDVASNGRALALERFYAPGVGTKIRLVEFSPTRSGIVLSSRLLASLEAPLSLDNFEGMSVTEIHGKRVIFLVSDNNFNAEQRTLIYAFVWE